jgi:hypothetical protein
MNFQDYCKSIDDKQKITAEKAIVITYSNSSDKVFSISPDSIRLFLEFFLESYESIKNRWETIPSRRDNFHQFEEKSYREIYRSADSDDLKIISSSGGSQTRALTQLISKIIAFLSEQNYQKLEINTFFSKSDVSKAIKNWDLLSSSSSPLIAEKNNPEKVRKAFKLWLVSTGLSERTSSSYSGTGINLCDKYLSSVGLNNTTLYELNSKQVLGALKLLKNNKQWSESDSSGNSMYSSACKKLAEFLSLNLKQSYSYPLPKPFLLLAGISGTGKTRFVREQAKATGSFQETYCLTSVRPDWHEPSELLGYIYRLDGEEKYITTDVLQFIAKAWRAMVDAELSIETQAFDNQGECLVVSGERDALNGVLPYWLCLDEMNLAPVEQYFADYLSVLETRAWHWDGNSFTYTCDALLKPTTIQAVADNSKLRSDLGFGDAKYDAVWALIGKHGLSIPFNLMVAGTVNMDETTHGFSRKVIDRALSFDFGEFFPNDYEAFFTPNNEPKTLSYPLWSHAKPEYLKDTFDTDGQQSIAFLTAVNAVLKSTPFELAYRALNELLLSVVSAQPQDQTTLAAVWDDFLMCKVLPRIEGDVDKLSSGATSAEAYDQQSSILQKLNAVLAKELNIVWNEASNSPQARPDLYRQLPPSGDASAEQIIRIACRSKNKLQWMQDRLTSAGFTSFWP